MVPAHVASAEGDHHYFPSNRPRSRLFQVANEGPRLLPDFGGFIPAAARKTTPRELALFGQLVNTSSLGAEALVLKLIQKKKRHVTRAPKERSDVLSNTPAENAS